MSEATSREEDLLHMKSNLQRLFTLAIESLEMAERAMSEGRAVDLSAQAYLAEHLKDTIYGEALFFIAKWQPLGHTLLYVESIIKVSYDLFRIVRYANEIALTLALAPPLKMPFEVLDASRRAREMLERAFAAFSRGKAELARPIEELDEYIDKIYRRYLKKIASQDKVSREDAIAAVVLRQIERVADHATYIARETLRAIGEIAPTI
jgi:phosphate transport system protein